MKKTLILLALTLIAATSLQAQSKETHTTVTELRNLLDVDRLPQYRDGIVEQISSYDPTGGNEDGFAGKYSFIRKEKDCLILADLKGPGVVNRIWTPTPTRDTLLFYFDGEKQPRLKVCFEDLFSGKVEPFVRPLCANEVGGFYCYFPFVYKKSLKIAFTGKNIQFHQIQYRSLDGKVETYTPEITEEIGALVGDIVKKWSNLLLQQLIMLAVNLPDVSQLRNHSHSTQARKCASSMLRRVAVSKALRLRQELHSRASIRISYSQRNGMMIRTMQSMHQ